MHWYILYSTQEHLLCLTTHPVHPIACQQYAILFCLVSQHKLPSLLTPVRGGGGRGSLIITTAHMKRTLMHPLIPNSTQQALLQYNTIKLRSITAYVHVPVL